jgi:hypothetical protein
LEELLEKWRFKQIEHYRAVQEHKLHGDLYQELAAELRYALDVEKKKAERLEAKP